MTASPFLSICVEIALILVIVSVLLGLIRLARGPSLADRVLALDMMTVSIVAFCALYSIQSGSTVFLDVAIVLALIGFLTTVALARFAERSLLRRLNDPGDPPDPFLNLAEHDTESTPPGERT